MNIFIKWLKKYNYVFIIGMILSSNSAFAQTVTDTERVGDIFKNLSTSFDPFIGVLFSIATLAGLIFTFIAIFKFKQFKDNPQQISIGQPIGLFFLGAVMLWLPYIIMSIGYTLTGAKTKQQVQQGMSSTHPSDDTGFVKDLVR